MLPQRTQGLPTATTNSITYVFLITATAEIEQTSPPTTLHSVFSLLPSVSLEVVRGARVWRNLAQLLSTAAALSNQQGILKSEHIPTPEPELWGPSLNSSF